MAASLPSPLDHVSAETSAARWSPTRVHRPGGPHRKAPQKPAGRKQLVAPVGIW